MTHELAVELAEKEFDKFREKQDHNFVSDFDKHLNLLEDKLLKNSENK